MYTLRNIYILDRPFNNMKRKVVKHGTTTLTISLPVQWVKKFDIKQGDELDVNEKGNKIIITPYNEHTENEYEVMINEGEYTPRLLVIIPYINGYDKIKIKFNNKSIHKYIDSLIKDFLMGFEIIEQGQNFIVIKNIAKGIEQEFDIILNRLIIIAISMMKDVKEAFEKKDFTIIENMKTTEMNANKINLFCRRMLNVLGHKERRVTSLYCFVNYLEHITDECNDLSEYVVKNKVVPSKEIIEYLNNLIQEIELWYKTFNEYKTEYITKMKIIDQKLYLQNYKLMEKCKKNETMILHHFLIIKEILYNMIEELG